MLKPKCGICGVDIPGNEHYYLIRSRTVCLSCESKMRPRLSKGSRVRIIREVQDGKV